MSILLISLFVCFGAWAKTLDQKELELKKIYEAGGITKAEYNKAQYFLENFEEKTKEKKSKPTFDLSKKKKSKKKSIFQKNKDKKDKDKEEITLEKIEELGQLIKFDDTYFTDGMIKEFGKCILKTSLLKTIKTLKISKNFAQAIFNDEKKHLIVKALVQMAEALELSTIADGVQNQDIKQALTQLGW